MLLWSMGIQGNKINYVDATSATLTIPTTINDGGTTRDTDKSPSSGNYATLGTASFRDLPHLCFRYFTKHCTDISRHWNACTSITTAAVYGHWCNSGADTDNVVNFYY